eukprot:jgi/Astpho2/2327/Aster-x0527
MSLKAVLTDSSQIKLFKNGLACLHKTGAELTLEATPEKLVLRSINSSKSAYASVTYYSRFFESFDVFDRSLLQAGMLMKQVLAVFRTQRMKRLTVELDTMTHKLQMTVLADNGLCKRYKVPCMEAQVLVASVDADALPTKMVARTGELSKLLGSFQASLEEITVLAFPDPEQETAGGSCRPVEIHSYHDPTRGDAEKLLHTELALDPNEVCDTYSHTSDEIGDVTFNLKDFKHMLSLCEAFNANVMLSFGMPGAAVVAAPAFAGDQELYVDAELILATLTDPQAERLTGGSSARQQAVRPPGTRNNGLHLPQQVALPSCLPQPPLCAVCQQRSRPNAPLVWLQPARLPRTPGLLRQATNGLAGMLARGVHCLQNMDAAVMTSKLRNLHRTSSMLQILKLMDLGVLANDEDEDDIPNTP